MRRESTTSQQQGRIQFSPELLKKIEKLPKPNSIRLKIISIGDEGVGKSCLIKRFCEEQFVKVYVTTIGVDFGVKLARVGRGKTTAKVNFWDLSGNPEYFEIRNEFYADAGGILFVYDVTKPSTFANLETWWNEATQFGAKPGVPVAVCGNKQDLLAAKPTGAVVPPDRAKAWCQSHGFKYYETSACTAQGVDEMFSQLFDGAYAFSTP
eukprot:TRINITY_DN20171_c0_g1_i1.p1 TRINITY_DN20171_c0_g1~~TRINITY_DN20171_c0_g1_i1.p1  ORF type:complete len:209 (+),score=27.06 TRINITY_DN20171_c0_g1_i1:55-681(+)